MKNIFVKTNKKRLRLNKKAMNREQRIKYFSIFANEYFYQLT